MLEEVTFFPYLEFSTLSFPCEAGSEEGNNKCFVTQGLLPLLLVSLRLFQAHNCCVTQELHLSRSNWGWDGQLATVCKLDKLGANRNEHSWLLHCSLRSQCALMWLEGKLLPSALQPITATCRCSQRACNCSKGHEPERASPISKEQKYTCK